MTDKSKSQEQFDDEYRKARLDFHYNESIRLFCERYSPEDRRDYRHFYTDLLALLHLQAELAQRAFIEESKMLKAAMLLNNPLIRKDIK